MRRRALAGFGAAGLALSAVPFFGLPAFYESFLYLVFHWIVLAVSWNILSGYSGYFSFGHGAFFGAGMYTTATLATKAGVPFLWTLPAAALVAAAFGVALGALVFRLPRLRGELFALLTLAVTFVLATIVLNTPIDGGPGLVLAAVPLPAIGPSPSSTFYLLGLALALATLWIAREVQRSSAPGSARASSPSTTTRTWPRCWACRPIATSSRRSACPADSPESRAASRPCSSPT